VGILHSIIQPAAASLQFLSSHILQCGFVSRISICHQRFWLTVFPHQFPEEFQCCSLVSSLRDNAFQDFALMINGAPQIVSLAIDLHKHFVNVPLPARKAFQPGCPFPTDLGSKQRAKPVPPIAHRFMADIDASLVKQVFHIPK
jgi:hypothetical protein